MKRAWLAAVLLLLTGLPPAAGEERPPAAAKASAALQAALGARARALVWVYLADKGPAPRDDGFVSARARARRQLRGAPTDPALDAPLHAPYVEAVARLVSRVRHQSRWLGAVSVEASPAQVQALAALPFVSRLDVVRVSRRQPVGPTLRAASRGEAGTSEEAARPGHLLDYGDSLGQLEQIGVPAVHDLGLHGEGVVVAVFDAGFDNLPHEAFAAAQIADRWDFVNNDPEVADGADLGEGSHGTATLSVLGGYRPGQLIGPAFASTFLLAKTENTQSEMPVEEDNWAAAAEWAEARGADVISSSLGYSTFDDPALSYSPAMMNGSVAISTRAAELAVTRGVVVVNSAGNAGYDPTANTLGAPADGFGVLAVAALDPTGTRTYFSSVGPSADGRIKPDLAAQGVAVKAASPFSTTGYDLVNGTSFSCPLAAGVAALLLQAHPSWTPAQVGAALRATASQTASPDNLLGWGRIDALAALTVPEPVMGRR